MEQLIHLVTLAIILITETVFGVSKCQMEKEFNSILHLFKLNNISTVHLIIWKYLMVKGNLIQF